MTVGASPGDPDDKDLDAIIEYRRALVRDRPGGGLALAALAVALLERADRADESGDPPGARADADEAIGWVRAGLTVASTDDAELARDLRAMLGIELRQRFTEWIYSDDEDPAALNRARADWTEAVTLLGGLLDALSREDPDNPDWVAEIEPFSDLLALGEALDPPKPADRDTFVTWGRWLLDRASSAS